MKPTIGRIVHYTLDENDVAEIRCRRLLPAIDGVKIDRGNYVEAGRVYPAIVVGVNGTLPDASVQLQVFLDGNDTHWATSRQEATTAGEHGRWFWPPITPLNETVDCSLNPVTGDCPNPGCPDPALD